MNEFELCFLHSLYHVGKKDCQASKVQKELVIYDFSAAWLPLLSSVVGAASNSTHFVTNPTLCLLQHARGPKLWIWHLALSLS